MNKLPDCPKCGEDKLWLEITGDTYRLHCYYCNLDSGLRVVPAGMTLDEHLTKLIGVVAAFYDKIAMALLRNDEQEAH